jgi:hypothetical protein
VDLLHYLCEFVLLPDPQLVKLVGGLYLVLVYQPRYDLILPELSRLHCQRFGGVDLGTLDVLKIVQRVASRRVHDKVILDVHQYLIKDATQNQDILLQYFFVPCELAGINLPRLAQRIINQDLHEQKVNNLRFLKVLLSLEIKVFL